MGRGSIRRRLSHGSFLAGSEPMHAARGETAAEVEQRLDTIFQGYQQLAKERGVSGRIVAVAV
jgi:hypothetical protein